MPFARTSMLPGSCSIGSEGSDDVWLDVDEPYEPKSVVLNVYDVTQERMVEAFNNATYMLGAGAYHVGIEVHRKEWSYGRGDRGTGIMQVTPRCHRLHRYRGAVKLGITTHTQKEVTKIIFQLTGSWLATDYNIFSKNCVHFAQAFVERLGVASLPAWVGRLTHALEPLTRLPALEEALVQPQCSQDHNCYFLFCGQCCKSVSSCLRKTNQTASSSSASGCCLPRYVPSFGEKLPELEPSRLSALSNMLTANRQECPLQVRPPGDDALHDGFEVIDV